MSALRAKLLAALIAAAMVGGSTAAMAGWLLGHGGQSNYSGILIVTDSGVALITTDSGSALLTP